MTGAVSTSAPPKPSACWSKQTDECGSRSGRQPSPARTAWCGPAELVLSYLGAASSVGLGLPGLVDVERGAVMNAVNLGVNCDWVHMRAELEQRLGVPVAVRLPDGALAGPAASLLGCLRVLVATTGCSVDEAVIT